VLFVRRPDPLPLTTSRLSIWLLCAGAVALACGPRARDAATSDSAAPHSAEAARDGSPLASSLDLGVADGVRLALHITNRSDSTVELQFPSGQLYDFVIRDPAGREVWRWGADRMFTQALQTRSLGPGQSLTFEERWTPGGITGTLIAVGRLASTNLPVEQQLEFTLP
jgi:hypothetical protein